MPEAPGYEEGFARSMALIESWGKRAQDQVVQAESMQRELEAMQVSVSSPKGEVTVTVDHTGLLRGISFSDRAEGLTAAGLSRVIMASVRAALDQLQAQVSALAERHFAGDHRTGYGDTLAESITTQYSTALSSPLAAYRAREDDVRS